MNPTMRQTTPKAIMNFLPYCRVEAGHREPYLHQALSFPPGLADEPAQLLGGHVDIPLHAWRRLVDFVLPFKFVVSARGPSGILGPAFPVLCLVLVRHRKSPFSVLPTTSACLGAPPSRTPPSRS